MVILFIKVWVEKSEFKNKENLNIMQVLSWWLMKNSVYDEEFKLEVLNSGINKKNIEKEMSEGSGQNGNKSVIFNQN